MELRELESKLRAAYIHKELAAQLAEKEYLKLKNKMQKKETNKLIIKAQKTYKELKLAETKEDLKKKSVYKKELQDQILKKYQEQQHKYQEFLREKQLLDDIIQRVYDEDVREMENKMCKMKKTKAEIDVFRANQAIWRQKEKFEFEEENKRIEEFLKNKELEDRQKKLQKAYDRTAKEKVIEEISKKIYIEQLQKKEREDVLQDLMEEEIIEKKNRIFKEKVMKQIQLRFEMENALSKLQEEQKKRLRQEELEDMHYKEQILTQKLEDDKLEQLSAEKRRRKIIELNREIQEHMIERRAKRAEELKTLLYFQEQDKLREENKKKIIEEERIKILQEHASNLIGYLPPGILKSDDLPHLGCERKKYYSK